MRIARESIFPATRPFVKCEGELIRTSAHETRRWSGTATRPSADRVSAARPMQTQCAPRRTGHGLFPKRHNRKHKLAAVHPHRSHTAIRPLRLGRTGHLRGCRRLRRHRSTGGACITGGTWNLRSPRRPGRTGKGLRYRQVRSASGAHLRRGIVHRTAFRARLIRRHRCWSKAHTYLPS